jgi:hypothetical protein
MSLTVTVLRPVGKELVEVTAIREQGEWECDDATFLKVLNMIQLPSGYHPDPDYSLVEVVANRYHGKIEDTRVKPPFRLDVVY